MLRNVFIGFLATTCILGYLAGCYFLGLATLSLIRGN